MCHQIRIFLTICMRFRYQYIKFRLRRGFKKRFGGYLSEASIYAKYPFAQKSNPHTKFIIFCLQRTGSSMLVNLLDSHPMIKCDGEILLDPVLLPKRYVLYRSQSLHTDVFGFKLQPHHFTYQKIENPSEFIKWLDHSGYKIIRLTRRNKLRTALSLYFAINSGRFHQSKKTSLQSHPKMIVDPSQLLHWIKWIDFNQEQLERLTSGYPFLEIFYEDHLIDEGHHQDTIDSISDFLDIPHSRVKTHFSKIMPEDISDSIENFSEIKDFIRKTNYAHYLEIGG